MGHLFRTRLINLDLMLIKVKGIENIGLESPIFDTMNAIQSNRLSIFLMTGSLLVLMVFLCFWLKNVYGDKYETLKKDTDYLFLGSIRSIEDKMLEDIYGAPFSFENSDSTGATMIKVHFNQKIDTFNSMAFIGKELERIQS